MSLFIGNLSARTCRDDLQHVFRKFGQCSLKLKDGYGFVVYDFPQDAEIALRALRGKNICGEPLILSWSKKQPIPFERYQRGVRSYELQHGRHFARGRDYASRKMSSNDWRDYRSDIKQLDIDGKKLNSADMLHEGRGDPLNYAKDDSREHHGLREGLPVDGGSDVAKLVDTGRWGGKGPDPSNANRIDNEVEFDRYDPCQGHDGEDEYENCQMAYSGGGSATQRPQENVRIEKISVTTLNRSNDLKPQITCFSCGYVGHKIRDCPRKYSSGRKPRRLDHRQDNAIGKTSRGETELEKFGSMSSENLQLNKDSASRHKKNKRACDSGKSQGLINNGRSPVTVRKETDRTEMKDHGGKKRSRWEGKSPKWHSAKKVRSVSLPPDSDYPASKSCAASQSSKSVSRRSSRTKSRSVSIGAQSLSSDSRSSSKSISSKSRSRSSSFTSLSESLSLSSFSPGKAHVKRKCSVYKTKIPKSKEILLEKRQPIGGHAHIENGDHESTMVVENNDHAGVGFEMEVDKKNDQPLQRDGKDNHNTSRSIDEDVNPSTPLSNLGAHAAGSSSPDGLKEKMDPQSSGAPVMESTQLKGPPSETPANYCNGRSTCISSEEMCMVLKHYGMELPEESERHLPIENYLGCARLWPWEIIYYRRLKKGVISVENYARRVSQNQQFGIIDKYIRSSSGWGEIDQENP